MHWLSLGINCACCISGESGEDSGTVTQLNVTSSVNETSSLNVTSPAEVFEAFEQFARALSSLFGGTDTGESTDEVKMHQAKCRSFKVIPATNL